MVLDIRGSLKNTRANNSPYVAIDELLSNAIDSYLIRKKSEETLSGLEVKFVIEFFEKALDDRGVEFKISCTDNGAGLGDEQVKAFVTKDTCYKDDLAIEGIGKCKGSGRIQFFHFFSKIQIDSIFQSGNLLFRRTLNIDENLKEIEENSFNTEPTDNLTPLTTIVLDLIKPKIYERFYSGCNLRDALSVDSLKSHVIVNFLQRFVSLQDRLGDFLVEFTTKYAAQEESRRFTKDDLPEITDRKEVNISYLNSEGKATLKSELFSVSHYKLEKAQYKLKMNTVALCAKSATVKIITSKYLRMKAYENNDVNGFYHIILVEGVYLDEHVNVQRDDFDIPKSNQQDTLFLQNMISLEQIYEGIEEIIHSMLTPPDWDKERLLKNIKKKYGVTSAMISDVNVRIHYGHSEEDIVKRVLKTYQDRIIKDTSDIVDLKEEVSKANPNSDDFRDKVNEFAWKFTSSLKSIDMANLSQIVVRRAAMIEILNRAVNRNLCMQTENEGRKCDEKIIHNIFFPMGKDSTEVHDHDVWLLNEEYHYYDYIASDKPLSRIKWDENSLLFEGDIDEKMQDILNRTSDKNAAKRPDIAIFNEEGSAIIIEFKTPGVNLDEHVGDLREYAQLLAAKSKGKLKKFYGYLLGTNVNPLRIGGSMTPFPNGNGWFNTEEIREPSTRQMLGELYYEILFYEDIVNRANKRLNVYKERLGIDLNNETLVEP